MGDRKRIFGYRCVFAMAALAKLATPVLAQQANIRSLYFHTIKQNRVGDYLAAEKEIVAIAKKSGLNHDRTTC